MNDTKRTIAGVEIPEDFGDRFEEFATAPPSAVVKTNAAAIQELQERILRLEKILLRTAGPMPGGE